MKLGEDKRKNGSGQQEGDQDGAQPQPPVTALDRAHALAGCAFGEWSGTGPGREPEPQGAAQQNRPGAFAGMMV
jgi:hypothetical protein